MEETKTNEEVTTTQTEGQTEEKKTEQKDAGVTLSASLLNVLFSAAAICLLILYHTIANFGVYEPVMRGIFAVIVYGASAFGVVWNFIFGKKFSGEFWLSVAALAVCLLAI